MTSKPIRWQSEVVQLVARHRVVLVSSGKATGASWLGAHLLLEESKQGRVSVGLTPNWEMQILGERLHDQIGSASHSMLGSKNGRNYSFPQGADIILSSQSNSFATLGRSSANYVPLTVVDTCDNRFDPKNIIQLIERRMRVVVLGRLRKTSWRSSYFDLWFQAAWTAAAEFDDWATYQATWNPGDNEFLTPHMIERLEESFNDE